jgi:hypothetical protein
MDAKEAIREPKQRRLSVPNLAIFAQNIRINGNILPLSAKFFPIYLYDIYLFFCGKLHLTKR